MLNKKKIFLLTLAVILIPLLIFSGCGHQYAKNLKDTGNCIPENPPDIDVNVIQKGYTYFIARIHSDHRFTVGEESGDRYVSRIWIVTYTDEVNVARLNEVFLWPWSFFGDYHFNFLEELSRVFSTRLFLINPEPPRGERNFNGFSIYYAKSYPGGVTLDRNNLLVYADNLLPSKTYEVYVRVWVKCKNRSVAHLDWYPYPVTFTFSLPETDVVYDTSLFYSYSGSNVVTLNYIPFEPIDPSDSGLRFYGDRDIFLYSNFFTNVVDRYYSTYYFYWGSGSNKWDQRGKLFSLEIAPWKDKNFSLFLYLPRGASWNNNRDFIFYGVGQVPPHPLGDDIAFIYPFFYQSLYYQPFELTFCPDYNDSLLWWDDVCFEDDGDIKRFRDYLPFLRKDSVFHRLREIVFSADPLALVFEDGRVMFVANGYKVGEQRGKWGDVLDKDKAFEKLMNGFSDWIVPEDGYLTGISPEENQAEIIEYGYDVSGYVVFKGSYSFKVSGLVKGGIVSVNGSPLILVSSGNVLKLYTINFENRELTLAGSLNIGLKGKDVRMVSDGMFLYLFNDNRVYKILVDGGDLSVVSQKNISGIPEGSKVWADVGKGKLIISWFQDVSAEDFVSRKGILLPGNIESIYKPYLRKLNFVVIHTDDMKVSGELNKLASIYYPAWEVTSPAPPEILGYGSVVEAPLFNLIDDDHIIFPGGWLYEIPDAAWREARRIEGAEDYIRYPLVYHPDPLVLKIK